MPKLTDAQLVILSAAGQRKDGLILPLPKSLKLDQTATDKALKPLLKQKLIVERPAAAGEAAWRSDGEMKYALVATAAGLQALDGNAATPTAASDKKPLEAPKKVTKSAALPKVTASTKLPKAVSKLGMLAELFGRKSGATIAEAMKATGWQAHSVRGAISGALKRKQGLKVVSDIEGERGRVYRIAGR